MLANRERIEGKQGFQITPKLLPLRTVAEVARE
jgi:hypothetical protein